MAEPLTKQDIICDCEIEYGSCSMQCTTEYVEIDKLKSALEEFEKEVVLKAQMAEHYYQANNDYSSGLRLALHLMKQAFPAIYDKKGE